MEMVYGGIFSMLVGWYFGRLMKLSDAGVVTCVCMAGGGSIVLGLPALWWSDIAVGKDGNIFYWGFLVGGLGGLLGVAAFAATRYLDWFVQFLKDNGLL